MPLVQFRSPLARAVFPVLGGAALLAAIFGLTWLIAARVSRGDGATDRLAPDTLDIGGVEAWARSVDEDGPILFPGLNTTTGDRTLVLDHDGDDPATGWRVFWAYPADSGPGCHVEQVEHSDQFTDCDGRTIDVAALEPADGVVPIVRDRERLSLDLRGVTNPTQTTN